MLALGFALLLFAAQPARIGEARCACDPAKPETMQARECSLCGEAEKQPPGVPVFFLKDNNPRKPNRWLALPRDHRYNGPGGLARMSPVERTQLWTAAIERARLLWGDEWGLAHNGDGVRTQCHLHIHIGKLLKEAETKRFIVVDGPDQIPVPEDGSGLWIHPHKGKLHVHVGEEIVEFVLMR